MAGHHRRQLALALLAFCLAAAPTAAITIQLDYTYDSSNFFPVGSQARTSLEAAASYFSVILDDTFSSIQTPAPLVKPNGTNVTWQWTMNFNHPSTNNPVVRTNQTVGADKYIIFAGARDLAGDTLGVGGPGGYTWSYSGSVDPTDQSQVQQISDNFRLSVEERHEESGFARWGGTISFDTSPPAPWHLNHTTAPLAGRTDLYSVAIHELAHALGFGEDDTDASHVTDWESFVIGSSFYGGNARAANGGQPVPLNPLTDEGAADLSHWTHGKSSVVYGSSTVQEAAMDPDLTTGTRKYFTALDAAAMKDIGWTVIAPPGIFGDYNNNGIVDAADYIIYRKRLGQSVTIPNDQTPGTVTSGDYTVWRNNFGNSPGAGAGAASGAVPEPGGATLAILGMVALGTARRKRTLGWLGRSLRRPRSVAIWGVADSAPGTP